MKQAKPETTIKLKEQDFQDNGCTTVCWLGGGGAFINSHGTCVFIDPVLQGYNIPLLIEQPIEPKKVPNLDAVLITHIDNDHFSESTCIDLKSVCTEYHSTEYVASVMKEIGLPAFGHEIGDAFAVKDLKVFLTATDHTWQNELPQRNREYKRRDYCGYYAVTSDGSIWMPGDSRLMESQLYYKEPDVILLDFSDNEWHIGLKGAWKLAETYPNAQLILIHWGTVDAPEMTPFNGNPEEFCSRVLNPERVHVLNPGQNYTLKSKNIV